MGIVYDRDGDELIPAEVMSDIAMPNGGFNFTLLDGEGYSLHNADLSELNLTGSTFADMEVDNARFSDSQMTRCSMINARFFNCEFDGVDFANSSFIRGQFHTCNFQNANLHKVNMPHADFVDSTLVDVASIKKASGWHELARGNGAEVVVFQLESRQVTFVLDWAFVACQGRPVHEFMSMSDAALLEHGGRDWLRWWKKYKGTLLEFIEAHNVRSSDF